MRHLSSRRRDTHASPRLVLSRWHRRSGSHDSPACASSPCPGPRAHKAPATGKGRGAPSPPVLEPTPVLSSKQPREGRGEGTEVITSGWQDPDRSPHSRGVEGRGEPGRAGPTWAVPSLPLLPPSLRSILPPGTCSSLATAAHLIPNSSSLPLKTIKAQVSAIQISSREEATWSASLETVVEAEKVKHGPTLPDCSWVPQIYLKSNATHPSKE